MEAERSQAFIKPRSTRRSPNGFGHTLATLAVAGLQFLPYARPHMEQARINVSQVLPANVLPEKESGKGSNLELLGDGGQCGCSCVSTEGDLNETNNCEYSCSDSGIQRACSDGAGE